MSVAAVVTGADGGGVLVDNADGAIGIEQVVTGLCDRRAMHGAGVLGVLDMTQALLPSRRRAGPTVRP